MKNKKQMMVVAVVAAVSLFSATAFASAPRYEGYEALKDILKSEKHAQEFQNGTVTGNFKLTDNGKVVVSFEGTGKMDKASKAASGNFSMNIEGIEREGSFYGNEDQAYFVDETNQLNYEIINMECDKDGKHGFGDEKEFAQEDKWTPSGEAFLDYMVGDLKDQVEVSNSGDGSKTITVDLVKSEIPAPVQMIIGMAASEEHSNRGMNHDKSMHNDAEMEVLKSLPFFQGFGDLENLEDKMVDLKKDVAVESMNLSITVDATNAIEAMTTEVTLTGKDAQGVAHTVTIELDAAVSAINQTEIDTLDTTGKEIQTIDAKAFDDAE